jgi:drug/metabolite transporter (DMT)-like permease
VRPRAEALLLFVTLLWGSTFIVTKDIVANAPPLTYLVVRFAVATVVMAVVWWVGGRRSLSRAALRDGVWLGLLNAGGLLFQVFGQLYTTASKSAFITSLNTPLTPVLALLLYRERPSRVQLIGVLVASSGLALLTWPADGARVNLGDLTTLGCSIAYATYIVEGSRRMGAHDARLMTLFQLAVGTLVFAAAMVALRVGLEGLTPRPALMVSEARPLVLSPRLMAQILYLAIGCGVIAVLVQTSAMARLSATSAAIIFALEPVFATAFAIAIDGRAEWPGSRGAAGAGVVLLAVALSQWRGAEGSAAPETG